MKIRSVINFAFLSGLVCIFVLSGCASRQATDQDDSDSDKVHSSHAASNDDMMPLEEVLRDAKESPDLITILNSSSFSGDKHINLKEISDTHSKIQLIFVCKQESTSSASIWLRRNNAMRRLVELGECNSPKSISVVGLTVSDFPKPEQAIIIANDDTKFNMVITNSRQEIQP